MHTSLVKSQPKERDQPLALKMTFARILKDARRQPNPYLEDCLVPEGGE